MKVLATSNSSALIGIDVQDAKSVAGFIPIAIAISRGLSMFFCLFVVSIKISRNYPNT